MTEWLDWLDSYNESRREASTTAVTTYPHGVSKTGVWDGSGSVWEWMDNTFALGENEVTLRGGAWDDRGGDARVSFRHRLRPAVFDFSIGVRVVVGPILK